MGLRGIGSTGQPVWLARPLPSMSAGASVLFFFPEHSESQSRGTGFVFKKVFILWEMKLGLVLGQGLREALRGEKMMLLLLPSFPLSLAL